MPIQRRKAGQDDRLSGAPLFAGAVMTLDLLIIFALTRFYAGTDGGR